MIVSKEKKKNYKKEIEKIIRSKRSNESIINTFERSTIVFGIVHRRQRKLFNSYKEVK